MQENNGTSITCADYITLNLRAITDKKYNNLKAQITIFFTKPSKRVDSDRRQSLTSNTTYISQGAGAGLSLRMFTLQTTLYTSYVTNISDVAEKPHDTQCS